MPSTPARHRWLEVVSIVLLPWLPATVRAEETATRPPVPARHAEDMARGLELYESKVRTLLIERCLECHGGRRTRGELDIATREALLRGGENGPAIVPTRRDESLLWQLVSHAREPHMPARAERLDDEELEAIGRWIDLGAPYGEPLLEREPSAAEIDEPAGLVVDEADRDWWAFRPLSPVAPPAVADSARVRTPVDRFVVARLEAAGIEPSPEADPRTLVRRLFLDLLGVPPRPETVDELIAAPSDAAWSELVDRLLSDRRHGERWARHWLDVARFAESHGFEHDYDRPHAYHYRDFVIRALTADMPFDQFVAWQIAGDELAPEDPLALMATGFLGAGVFPTQITKREVERTRYDALDDMASTTFSAMLGLTLGCARCHDHKYDPIPTREYYEVLATFTTTVRSEVEIELDPERTRRELAEFEAAHAPIAAAVERYEREELPSRLASWLDEGVDDADAPYWSVLAIDEATSHGGATLERLDDGSVLATGENPAFDRYTFVAETRVGRVTGMRLEALAHESMVRKGPGRAGNGNICLSHFRVSAEPLDGSGPSRELELREPQATFEQNGAQLAVRTVLEGKKGQGWAVDPRFGEDHAAVFELSEPLDTSKGVRLTFFLSFDCNTGHNIGRARLAVTTRPGPLALAGETRPDAVDSALAELRAGSSLDQLDAARRDGLLAWYRQRDAGWIELDRRRREHLASKPRATKTKVQVTSEGLPPMRHHTQGADFFPETYHLERGDPERKKEVAEQGFLTALTRLDDGADPWIEPLPEGARTSGRRRALARWLTDVEHGAGNLLARVIVNRIWQHHFGRGLVATPNDFGLQGSPPTHPELLEWLAVELVQSGWRLSRIHRLILESATWRQSSRPSAERAERDPSNELLWRWTPRRLEAEALRDVLLSVSGALDATPFGPGSLDPAMRRRSVYFTIKRSQLPTFLQLFDFPEPNTSQGARPTTTIAPQALLLLNSEPVRAWAKEFATRVEDIARSGGTPDPITAAYRLALSRAPTAAELTTAERFLERQTQAYTDAGHADGAHRALTDLCHAIFGLNELAYME